MPLESDAKPFIPETKKSDPYLRPDYEIKQQEVVTVATDEDLEQFFERHHLPLTPFEYPRSGTNPGLVLIFNQESFEDKTYRLGSRRDVNEIVVCMSRLGFNITKENNIFTDLSRDAILECVHRIVSSDLSEVNSLIVFFLTHGDSFNILHSHDCSLQANELWKEFVNCEHLKNKPKMFIFQACKGDSYSTTSSEIQKNTVELVPSTTFSPNYIGPDMLVVYSTTEGNVSFRDPKFGTWFIQELCKNFSAYGRRDDVISLIMRTTKCLCRNYYHSDRGTIKKQMPVFVSTLKKKFYLNRYKDRNVFIKLLQDQESMQETISDLKAKVNELLQEKDKKSQNK